MSEIKDLTIMVFFAGDNALAPLVISQIKEIKDAGFRKNIDVLVYFDPNEMGVPTKILDVNRRRKESSFSRDKSGDGNDPFVRNMEEDILDSKDININDGNAVAAIRRVLENSDGINAEAALTSFLNFCADAHEAKHYMLFLVGHGLIVGNDAFLPDDVPVSGITLEMLGDILQKFNDQIKETGTFELLGLHSCSMSAIEVAYQIKGTAKYMIASEGPEFINSWPYRQLLKKIFNHFGPKKKRTETNAVNARVAAETNAENAREATERNGFVQPEAEDKPKTIQDLIESLYFLKLHNGTDFLVSGYSYELALCNLDPKKFDGYTSTGETDTGDIGLTGAIQNLVKHLTEGLTNNDAAVGERTKEIVLLAHWEAQSYWAESYTDLFDFCQCLENRCGDSKELKNLRDACSDVIKRLTRKKSADTAKRFDAIVIHSGNFGSTYQYSHGLSIYFPWSRPIEVLPDNPGANANGKEGSEDNGILGRYQKYIFTTDLGDHSWFNFLDLYFSKTMRRPRLVEDGKINIQKSEGFGRAHKLFLSANSSSGNSPGGKFFAVLSDPPKSSPAVGIGCTCASIKNYPPFSITENALKPFEPEEATEKASKPSEPEKASEPSE